MPVLRAGLKSYFARNKEKEQKTRGKTKSEIPDNLKEQLDKQKIDLLWNIFRYALSADTFSRVVSAMKFSPNALISRLFDADGSGLVSVSELGMLMRTVGENPIETRLREMVAEVDEDGNGDLSFGEFIQLWFNYMKENDSEEDLMRMAFEFFDKDGSGSISLDEFKEVLLELGDPLTEEEYDLFWGHVDQNNDGSLQYEEFIQFLKNEGHNAKGGGTLGDFLADVDLSPPPTSRVPGGVNSTTAESAPTASKEAAATGVEATSGGHEHAAAVGTAESSAHLSPGEAPAVPVPTAGVGDAKAGGPARPLPPLRTSQPPSPAQVADPLPADEQRSLPNSLAPQSETSAPDALTPPDTQTMTMDSEERGATSADVTSTQPAEEEPRAQIREGQA